MITCFAVDTGILSPLSQYSQTKEERGGQGMSDSHKLPTKPLTLLAGANTVVRKAIVDKNARIGSDVRITNEGNIKEANKEDLGFVIKDGIVVVIKDSIIPNGTVI